MAFLFTSESVSEGHPDKIADQISDAILDAFLALDPNARVACETFVTTGLVVVGGEFRSSAKPDIQPIVREVIRRIGYIHPELGFSADACGIISVYHEQSADIAMGVDRGDDEIGAGDQGLMFGYATTETHRYVPLTIDLSHVIMQELSKIRKHEPDIMPYLRPDAKAQVTVKYEERLKPVAIDTILISTQHEEPARLFPDSSNPDSAFLTRLRSDVINVLLPRVLERYKDSPDIYNLIADFIQRAKNNNAKLLLNPTGRFVIGGPHGDTGLTGRKIIVDTYGGWAPHGGGAFSGKDPTKVDRSAAYMARYAAKNLVAAGVAKEVTVQVAYAIGIADPASISVQLNEPAEGVTPEKVENTLRELFDFRPAAIINTLQLNKPIYFPTASYGHMGRTPESKQVNVIVGNETVSTEVTLFPWEKLDRVEEIKDFLKIA